MFENYEKYNVMVEIDSTIDDLTERQLKSGMIMTTFDNKIMAANQTAPEGILDISLPKSCSHSHVAKQTTFVTVTSSEQQLSHHSQAAAASAAAAAQTNKALSL